MNIKLFILPIAVVSSLSFAADNRENDNRENGVSLKRVQYNWSYYAKWGTATVVTGLATAVVAPSIPFLAVVAGAVALANVPPIEENTAPKPSSSRIVRHQSVEPIEQPAARPNPAPSILTIENAVKATAVAAVLGGGGAAAYAYQEAATAMGGSVLTNAAAHEVLKGVDYLHDKFTGADKVRARKEAIADKREIAALHWQQEAAEAQWEIANNTELNTKELVKLRRVQAEAAFESEQNTKEMCKSRVAAQELAKEMRDSEQYMKSRDKFDLEKMIRGDNK